MKEYYVITAGERVRVVLAWDLRDAQKIGVLLFPNDSFTVKKANPKMVDFANKVLAGK